MNAINLYTFTRIQQDYATEYENLLSRREKKEKVKQHEYETIKTLVDILQTKGVDISKEEGFFYSFRIEQIGKEFDLLKIDKNHLVLNIELKSEHVGEDKIKKQLEQNKYYLNHIADELRLFTFIGETQTVYEYIDESLVKVSIDNLINVMQSFKDFISKGIEFLFDANNYLISPLNTPEAFLEGQYFLTNQQEEIKKKILDIVADESDVPKIFGIKGKAGTGKTLLLYDIVRTIASRDNRCCVVHSGILCDGHEYINLHCRNIHIVSARELNGENNDLLANYDSVFVDESQRIYKSTAKKVINEAIENGKLVVFSYDFGQALSHAEENRNIPDLLKSFSEFREYNLSEKIRTSKEIASFYRTLLNLGDASKGYMNYSDIDVLYANNVDEALKLIRLYEHNGYIFISYTQSVYNYSSINEYPSKHNTHHVLGQEYDKVMIMMDDNFRYDADGKIQGKIHPNPDYVFYKLLYQGVSRARERLCILVVDNYLLFKQISNIKYQMLERYQYRENTCSSQVFVKKLEKLIKSIKQYLCEVDPEDAETIDNAIAMIKEELLEVDPKKRVINSGVKLLEMIKRQNIQAERLCSNVQEYIDYVDIVSVNADMRKVEQ